jgi:hypothetical protein
MRPDQYTTGGGALFGKMPAVFAAGAAAIPAAVAVAETAGAAAAAWAATHPGVIGFGTAVVAGVNGQQIGGSGAARGAASVLENSGPIARSLGAASRAEMVAKQVGLNINSPTSRQILNSLGMKVTDFIGKYRAGSIRGKFPSEFLDKTVEEALTEGGSIVRKLLTDGRFVK